MPFISSSNDSLSVSQRRRWSKDEDDTLTAQVNEFKKGSSVDWRKVSQVLPNRNNKDCRKRWLKIDATWRQGQWSKTEDEALRRAIAAYRGQYPWKAISDLVATRNPDQCAKRWRNALDPHLIRGDWTSADDLKLEHAIKTLGGRHWRRIVEDFFPGRSRLDLSNRYTMLLRKKRLGHRRNFSNVTTDTNDANQSESSSPEDSGNSQLSPMTERSDDCIPTGAVMRWDTSLDQHGYSTLDPNVPHIVSADMQPSEHAMQNPHYDGTGIKVEEWCAPVSMAVEHSSSMIQHHHHPGMEMYEQYPQWNNQWTDSKAVIPTTSSASFETSYAGHDSFSIESHTEITNEGTVTGKRTHRRTITLDNVDDSTRAIVFEAACKGRKSVTLVIDEVE